MTNSQNSIIDNYFEEPDTRDKQAKLSYPNGFQTTRNIDTIHELFQFSDKLSKFDSFKTTSKSQKQELK